MRWFRLYAEFASDPKVQILSEILQRRYIMVLCLHSNKSYQNRPEEEVALALRISLEDWHLSKKEFIKRGLMCENGNILGWEKRQYISDISDPTAAVRQKRYRKKKTDDRNATVTSRLPEQNRTEQKQNRKKGASPLPLKKFLLEKLPDIPEAKQIDFMPDEFADLWLAKSGGSEDKLFVEWEKFVTYFTGADAKRPEKKDWLGAWRNWITK